MEQFLTLHGYGTGDYFSHSIAPNENSSKMHIVLDIYCKAQPDIDIRNIAYTVFKVKRNKSL